MKKINNIGLLTLFVILGVLLSACSLNYVPSQDTGLNNALDEVSERSIIMFDEPESEEVIDEERGIIKYAADDVDESDVSLVIEVVEGELVDLQPRAVDPDEDKIKYSFTGPFNEAGLWQTTDGDAGKYLITITATDGDLIVMEYVLIIVNERNKAPVIECPEIINVLETDTIELNCNFYDVEGNEFDIKYSGWMTSDTYTTTYNDAGEYTVVVTAYDDMNNTVTKKIKINVKDKNRSPVLENVQDISAIEYDVIVLNITATDADGDDLNLVYGSLFDEDGMWITKDGDAGSYVSYVKVTDGTDTITKKFNVFIENINTRPSLAPISEIVVDEGETIRINVNATDAENDALTITFSGWMTSDMYTATYDDAGTHYVKVTVSDGRLETSQNVKIIVNNVNRPPMFVVPA